ncbi:MAG: hypothetical protein MJK04_28110, partial [Psychrosphaera sp.]|nr:hypothetical protein [Psychrosphaera sp.]
MKTKINLTKVCLSVGLLLSSPLMAADNLNTSQSSATALSLGTPASFLSQLNINRSAQLVKQATTFTLINPLGEDIKVVSDNFSVENDGTLSMNGKVQGFENSEFILQGDDKNVYGWVILKDQDIAYEYTTNTATL